MSRQARIAAIVGLFLVVNIVGLIEIRRAVTRRSHVTIESVEPEGRVNPYASVSIRFSEPMVLATALGKDVETDLVAFEPGLKGVFRWKNPRTLCFFPEKPLPGATAYVGTVAEEITSLAGHTLADDAVFSFHTPPLELERVTQTNFSRNAESTLALEFNDKVSPEQVAGHLTLRSPDDKKVKFELQGKAASGRVVVRTHPYHQRRIVVTLAPGLKGQSGPLGMDDEVRRVVDLDSALVIRRVDGAAPGPGRIYISVRCSQRIDTDSAQQHLDVKPAVKFTVESGWSGFTVHGDFAPGTRYELVFRKGMKAVNGAALATDVTRTVRIPDYRPSLAFPTHGFYLSTEGNLLVPLETVNLPKVELVVRKCYANNVVHYLRDMNGESDTPGGFGREVARKLYRFDAKSNEVTRTNIDLQALLGEKPQGVYHLMAENVDKRWHDCTKLVLVTDLGISVKRSPTDVLVWVNALSSTTPVGNARVSVYTRTNQLLAEGTTDANGVAHFKGSEWTGEDEPFLVAATSGPDDAFVQLSRGQWDNSGLDTGGRPYLSQGYEAFLHTDRGIYRPGDTVHLRAIVRGPGMKAPEPFPVQVRIERPDGRRFKTFTAKLSRWGTAEVDVPLPEWARLGRYRAEVHLPQGKEKLGAEVFRVEEFMPDRMKVEATADERRYGPGDTIQVTVTAKHLFGAPAAGRKAFVRSALLPADFKLDDAKSFRFADSGKKFEPITENLGHAVLDENGQATFAFSVPKKLAPPSALIARFVATVREVGGRAVSTSLVRDVDPYPHYIGLARERDGAVEPRKSERFLVKAVRPDGSPAPAVKSLKATLHRVVWNTILRRDPNGRYRYVSEREERPAGVATVAVQNGAGAVAFTPPAAGLYRLRVADEATGVSADLTFHCSGYGYVPWAREKPERLELVPDKKSYAPGETARVLIKAPFAGQALVTIEGDRVHLARTVTLEKNTGEFTFPVQAAYGPNVYCTAAVVRRVRPGAKWAPHRAFGSVPIVLDSAPQRLTVEVGSPKETRPGGPLRVAVKVRDAAGNGTPAEVTLAAVDEGICQLIRFETPDPWGFFYGQRSLDVRSSDVYALLMPEVEKRKVGGQAAPGGGGPGDDERRRLNPIRADRVKTVALWQGAVETAPDGTAEVVLDVPRFNGQLRLMAVATGTSHFGSAEQPVVVKQPLLIRTTFPRFLSPGDEFAVPVAVFNNTKQGGDVKLTITGGDGVEFSPTGTQAVRVAAGKEGTVVFNVHASAVPGVMKLNVSAVLGDETATEDVEIAVRPPATLRFASGSGAVPAGQAAHFDVPGGWVEGTAKYSLTFTSLPGIKLGNSLRYVLHYPYGCVEQTTSSALPLLYLGDVAALAEPDVFGGDSIEPNVQAGIDRVLSMQIHTGGFGYWPGDYSTYPWGSAYATHFLVEARKAGYAVYKDNLDAALAYLDTYLKEEEDDKHTLPVKAYACFVLALGGQPNRSWAQRLFEDRSALPPYSRCHLAAALALTKQLALAKTLIGSVPVPDGTGPADTGGLLHSSTREAAILLSVFADVAPDHPNIPELLRRLEKAMDNGRWRSTQENAFALMALGKYLRHKNEKDVDFLAEASVDGKHLPRFTHNDRVRLAPEKLGGRTVNVKVEGKGTLYYYWTAEGVPTSGKVPEFDNGLTIRRTLRSRDGRELNAAAIPHGEVVVIDLAVRANRTVENVAISDLLPAGFEIENPRLATAETVRTDGDGKDKKSMRENLLDPDRVEMRDDRLLLFTTVGSSKTYHYRYVVRAVTQGTFALPPVSASCMYDPGIASTHGAGHIQVVGQ